MNHHRMECECEECFKSWTASQDGPNKIGAFSVALRRIAALEAENAKLSARLKDKERRCVMKGFPEYPTSDECFLRANAEDHGETNWESAKLIDQAAYECAYYMDQDNEFFRFCLKFRGLKIVRI